MLTTLQTHLASAAGAQGALVVGARGVGKTWIAHELHRSLGDGCELLDASTHLTGATDSGSGRTKNRVTRDVDGLVDRCEASAAPPTWIIDNAEVLLAWCGDGALARLARCARDGKVRLVLVRNRFVREHGGYLPDRAAPFAELLPRFDLAPFDDDEGAEIFGRWYSSRLPDREERGRWLQEWSGGVGGIARWLKPSTPNSPRPDEPPADLADRIDTLTARFALDRRKRRAVLSLMSTADMPPPALLSEVARNSTGYLQAAAIVHADYHRRRTPLVGRLWRVVAKPPPGRRPARDDDAVLRLGDLLAASPASSGLPEELDIDDGPLALAEAFARSVRLERTDRDLAVPLRDFLADSLGRVGLRAVLRQAAAAVERKQDATVLATTLLELAGVEAA